MHRNRSVDAHKFSMIPNADIPRSSFKMQKTLKTTFDAGLLIPILCEEILPGDTFNCRATIFCRMATPIFPFMDNLYLETFFFFIPNRLVWANWVKFMGEQNAPGDSISYTVPTITSPAGGYAVGSLFDMFGLPTVGQIAGGATITHSCLPLRGYQLVYNQWFRDENLCPPFAGFTTDDGPDLPAEYALVRRGKRHDYFTSCLPWTQKGGIAVSLPLGTTAPVKGIGLFNLSTHTDVAGGAWNETTPLTSPRTWAHGAVTSVAANQLGVEMDSGAANAKPLVYADLSLATAATINQLRQAFQIQKLLERDARGGTRYIELVRSHFGVISPDARLQRAEYLGGGKTPVVVNSIAQTSATGLTGGSAPLGNLAAMGTALAHGHGFTQSFTEHGYVLGIACVDADLTYQQGLRRHWSRSTRYDFYFPVFAMLGEQAVLNKEIYCRGDANDNLVFGYQERWAEYRYNPSEICGLFKSTAAGTIDAWHLSQRFTALPLLNSDFIFSTPPVSRVVAVGSGANGQQFLCDAFFDIKAARPMPMYSVPGLIDHF